MSQIYTAEPRSPIEPIVIQAFPRHPDGSQVLIADVDTIDFLVFADGDSEPIWNKLDEDPATYMSDTPTTWAADTTGYTLSFTLPYGQAATPVFYPDPGSTVAIHVVLNLAAGGVQEIEVHVPLRDSLAARNLGL